MTLELNFDDFNKIMGEQNSELDEETKQRLKENLLSKGISELQLNKILKELTESDLTNLHKSVEPKLIKTMTELRNMLQIEREMVNDITNQHFFNLMRNNSFEINDYNNVMKGLIMMEKMSNIIEKIEKELNNKTEAK